MPTELHAQHNPLEYQESRARRLAIRVLKSLQPIEGRMEPDPARGSERLDPAFRETARRILSSSTAAVDSLQLLARHAKETFDVRYGGRRQRDDPELWAATASMLKIRKYEQGVTGQYQRFAGLVGGEIPTAPQLPAWMRTLRVTAELGVGANNAETHVGGTLQSEADATRSVVAADVSAELTPEDRVGVSLRRTEDVSFGAQTNRTNVALRYDRRLHEQVRVSSRLGVNRYANEDNDATDLNQTEFVLQARAEHSRALKADASLALAGASYPNNGDLDYGDTRFAMGAGGRFGAGSRWRVKYGHTKHDVDLSASVDDNTQNRFDAEMTLVAAGGSSYAFVLETEAREFDDGQDVRDYTRRGFKVKMRGRTTIGNSNSASLEFRSKSFDELEDLSYTEIRSERRSNRKLGETGKRSLYFWINYRQYKGDGTQGLLDYVELRNDTSRETANAMFWDSGIYAQYFLESEGIELDARFNQYLWFGAAIGEHGEFRIGPHVATNTILATADVPGRDIDTFDHPGNTVRFGLKAAASVRQPPLRLRGQSRYERLRYYNLDSDATPTRFELSIDGTYDFDRRFGGSLKLAYHETGSDDPGALETSEFEILLGVVYRFDAQR